MDDLPRRVPVAVHAGPFVYNDPSSDPSLLVGCYIRVLDDDHHDDDPVRHHVALHR
jgi:hypothetical protein